MSAALELSQRRRLLLERLLRQQELAFSLQGNEKIPRRAGDGPAPLSFGQQRLWFIDQLEPGKPLYNMPVALRVEGPLNPNLLALCLGEIVRRHEVLRTAFATMEGAPVQVILPALPFRLSVVDLSELPENRRDETALALADAEAARPFDLAHGLLLRGVLLRLAGEDHLAALTLHHIVSDAWSMGILVREVAALYPALVEGRPSPLPELPVQYADFSVWQSSWLRGGFLESEIAFWRRQLAGLPPLLELPTDRPRPAVQSFRGASPPVRLPAALTSQVMALGRHEGATLFMVLLAGFEALLTRTSGQPDFAVGTPVSGRNWVEIEGLIGFFVNTLVLRSDLAGNRAPSFQELIGRVRETALVAHAHQDVPFEKLVQELTPERSLAHTPLFQVMFVLQNAPVESLEIQNLRLRPVSGTGTTAKFDLTLSLSEWNGGLRGTVEYATDLFDAATIDRLIIHYGRLLTAALAAPELMISELPLLGEAERHQLLTEWGNMDGPPQAVTTLHSCFEAHAQHAPEAPALTFGSATISYGELNRRSNQLARWLRRHGVGPESRVGLCLERSLDLVVGILGVLKAGGAYVPLDPGGPRERIAYIIEDAGVQIVVGTQESVGLLPDVPRQILLDTHRERLEMHSAVDLEPLADEASLAYTIYTSGSTGRPKGALVSHGNVTRLFAATRPWFGFGERDAWTLFHSYAFDFSVWEIWGALLHGGRLVIVPYEVSRSPELFLDLLIHEGITVLNQTPSAFTQLTQVDEERGGVSTDLRVVIFGGEALDPAALAPWFSRHGDERPLLVNMYGITETTVHVTYRPLRAADAQEERRSVIGVPIPDMSLAVMDPGLRPAPIGVPGELVIGGAGLARGYLGQPELTAERFVPDPVGSRSGSRLYRSGDRGRFLPDGDVEYLGRIDHQVKIRGFRIELGEIEALLVALSEVREAVVVAREDIPGDRRLVAYVVGNVAPDALVRALRARLPDYMVPAAFVTLAALPLTTNGKVDRKALPAPEWQSAPDSYLAPRTPVEEVLAGIWAEILGLERVGADDNFFDLGGHSLLATQVMSRLRGVFDVELPLRDLFEAPRLADLAARVEAARRAGAGRLAPPLVPVPREGPLPLSFAQQRLWFIDQLQPGSPLYNIPLAARMAGPLDRAALEASLGEVVARHESMRTTFPLAGVQPVQRIAATGPWLLPQVDLRALLEDRRLSEARQLATEESRRPFDLALGPLLRTTLLRLGEREHALLVTQHHIVSDGWSVGVLMRELAALYPALAAGHPSPLPPLPLQFPDFAVWQRSWLQGEVLEHEIAFWREQLAGAPAILELPTDRPRPAATSFRGAQRDRPLSPELGRAVRALARRQGATSFMTLLAALGALLARSSGQPDVMVASAIANRHREEIEDLIGLFVNTLALRVRTPEPASFAEVLATVRETTLAAYAHQDLPFEKLIDALDLPRDLSVNPLCQVMLSFQNLPPTPERIPGLEIAALAGNVIETGTAKFDLTLSAWGDHDRLGASLQFNSDLFDAPTAERLLGHLEILLTAAATHPQMRISDLPLVSEAERHQLVVDWNDTASGWAADTCLHTLFTEQARRTPENIAAVFETESLTYTELERRSNRLAHHLRRLSVGPESRVALCFERSLEMVIAVLGVLKAGGTYVPLDPNAPRERLTGMLDDLGREGGPPPLLTQSGLVGRLPMHGGPLLRLDIDGPLIEGPESEPPASGVMPGHTAYILYTSGSTGVPKGVAVEHRQILNYLRAVVARLELAPEASAAMLQPLTVDSSKTALYPPLLTGGTLHLISEERALDAESLGEYFKRHAVDMLKIAPSHFAALQSALAAPEAILPRGWLVTGGEASRWEWSLALAMLKEDCRVFIHYGPTEATVGMLAGRVVTGLAAGPSGTSPLGRPLAGTRTYLLDPAMQLVALGVSGELYIGGACLARGYDRRPDLTAERFLPDRFATEPGGRLYRTGDLARYLPDGRLEFLGRFDHQVKIRGFRVELGEIEVTLSRYPGVRESVVVARQDDGGPQRLVAYLLARGAVPPDLAEVQRYAQENLPGFMVPAAFVWLTEFPRSPHGKLDRKQLPAPEPAPERIYEVPGNSTEEKLAEVWRQVLRVERIGVHDNFFELGGDSILSIQVIARAAAAGLRLTARQVFEHPTVARLAAVAREEDDKPATAEWREGPVPLTPIQRRFFELDLAHPAHYNQAVLLSLAHLDPELLGRALDHLLVHHDALCVRFERQGSGPGSWQQVLPAGRRSVPLLQIDLAALPQDRRRESLEEAASRLQASLDLSQGPLLRAALFSLGSGQSCRLLLTVHHLIIDGVSWRILLADLETACRQLAANEMVVLPPKTSSYQSWADRLVAYAESPELVAQAALWLTERRRPPSQPLIRVAAPGQVTTASRVAVALDPLETRALLQDVPRAYRTQINDALLTALVEAYGDWTGSRRLLVDLEGHGREELFPDLDLSRTVGWFTCIHPVLLDTMGAIGPGAALCAVKEQLRAVPDHGIGYGVLRFLGRGEVADALRALPRAGVLFNYLGQLDQALPTGSLFQAAGESAGEARDRCQLRLYPVEIQGSVLGGRLQLTWTCNACDRDTVEVWAERFLQALRKLIEHCLSPEAGGYTPSDFSLARVSQAGLDRLAAEADGAIEDLYPVSPLQEGILFHSLHAPQSGVYVEQLSLRLQAGFDAGAFEHAWEQVVRRHPALRTTFHGLSLPRPLQLVHAEVRLPWERRDWRHLSPVEQQERLASFLEEDRRQGFDLTRPPLLRFTLIRLSEQEYQFVWSHHHILSDGWSTSVLLDELVSLYEAALRGEEARLGRVRAYRDFIAWLEGNDSTAAEAFWRRTLQGFKEPTVLGLPAGPAAGEAVRGEHSLLLPAPAMASLQRFSRTHQLTLATVVQGAWALLLARYGGGEDVLFGLVTAGRSAPLAGIASMVGLFINTLPVRVRIPGDAELIAWLRNLQESQVEIRQHESSRLTEIQGWSEIPRGASLFESILVLQNYPVEATLEQRMGRSLRIAAAEVAEQTNYPLCLDIALGTRLLLKALYDGRRFDRATIDRMLVHLRNLFVGISAGAGERLEDLPLLSDEERHQLLVEWNDSGAELPAGGAGLMELIAARAVERPEDVAAVWGDRQVSYRELTDRSERLARALAEEGVGPESRVALLAERSLDFLAAILGIFRAGGAYLPLDPSHPPRRLAGLLADSGVELALADHRCFKVLADVAAELPAAARPRLRSLEELLGDEAARAIPLPRSEPGRLAYLIYTSGSTGAPKGALIDQGGLLNHLWAKVWDLGLGPGDAVAQTASQCFDISVWQFLAALLVGGRVHVLPDEVAHHPQRLLAEVEHSGITVLETVPSLLRLTLDDLERQGLHRPALNRLRWLIPTGEALPPELCRQWLRLYPGVPLLNAYGPTECSDDVTHQTIRHGQAPERATTPIGRPVANLRLYVLDGKMMPLPAGVAGELFVGGAGVGRGYLGDGARTAQTFLPDPFSGRRGQRLYRTGDRARWLTDGRLELLGRIDHQVKIRGHRIEPGEIEAALLLHPAVRACAVVAREELGGEPRLVAYLVSEGQAPAASEVRNFLRARLPEPLVPSAFVDLLALPLTANGKLDRRALPDPDPAPGVPDDVAPLRPVEEVLAGIWAEVLGRDHIGRRQSFFELGGHSLLATRAISALRQAFQIDLPLRALFDTPTVAELAKVVEAALGSGRGLAARPIERAPRWPDDSGSPLSFSQQRLWFLDRLDPESSAYNVPAAVRLTGGLHVPALAASLDEIVRRHEALRTFFREVRDEPIQVIAPAAPVPLPVVDLRALTPELRDAEARRLAREAARRPFDLARGPLLRIRLLRLGDEEHLAVFVSHHIVSDGWSMGVLVREVATLYAAFVRGVPSPLPELPVQYADFARWQRQWLQGEVLERSLFFWTRRLAGTPALLELPGARPRPKQPAGRGAARSRLLPPELARGLQALGRRESVTLFMTLLAAFQAVLHARTGATDIVVGTDVAGRDRAETEGLIGFFINQLALRGDLSGNPTFQEMLGRTREALLAAYTHQDLPFDRLVEALGASRDLRHAPVFQVKLVLQNAPRAELRMPGLAIQPFDLETATSQIDLNLRVAESAAGLFLSLAYSTEVYDAGTVDRLLEQLEILLRSVVVSPEARLHELVAAVGEAGRSLQAERDRELRQASREKLLTLRRRPASKAGA